MSFAIHYQPWGRVSRTVDLPAALQRFFGTDETQPACAWAPRVDVREEAQRYVIEADLPGVALSEVGIETDKNVLTIQGERKVEATAEGVRATRSERSHGSFQRSFTLPESADTDAISASGKDGVLTIVIPKKAQAAPRRVAVAA